MHNTRKILTAFLLGMLAIAGTSVVLADASPSEAADTYGWAMTNSDGIDSVTYDSSTGASTSNTLVIVLDQDPGNQMLNVTIMDDSDSPTIRTYVASGQTFGIFLDKTGTFVLNNDAKYKVVVTGIDVLASCNLEYGQLFTVSFSSRGTGGSIQYSDDSFEGSMVVLEGTGFTVSGSVLKIGDLIAMAVPSSGYSASWGTVSGTIASDRTFTATFTYSGGGGGDTYTVTIQAGTGGTVSRTSVTGLSGTTAVSASGNVLSVGTVSITASADDGYEFVSWTNVPASGTITSGRTITATFQEIQAKTYTITITQGQNGTISGPSSVEEGDYASYTIIPDDDYIIEDVVVDGKSLGAKGIYVFTNVNSDHTISATYIYQEGAETEEDEEGNVITTYTDIIEGIEVEVVDTYYTDGSSYSEAIAEDDGVTTTAIISTSSSGLKTEVIGSEISTSTGVISKEQMASAQDSISAVSEALDSKASSTIDIDASSSDEVKIDVSGFTGSSEVIVTTDTGSISFDSRSFASIIMGGSELRIVIVDEDELTDAQKKAAQGNQVYDIYAEIDGKVIKNFDGTVTLVLPYELKTGETASSVAVYYLADDASVEKIGGTYSDGFASVTLSHLSYYFVSGSYVEPEPSSSDNTMMYIALAIIIILIIIGLAYYFLVVKKRA